MSLRVLICCVGAALLSSCYTNVNQMWFKGKREYEVSHLDYHTDASIGVQGLAPVLYRCGDDWYIAAKYTKQRDAYPGRGVQWVGLAYEERHRFELKAHAPVYYHKITPAMANMLLKDSAESRSWFSEQKMRVALAQAGGSWVAQLPPGSKPVPSAFLRRCHSSLMLVDERNYASWMTYPASWLTFLCVDVPASTFTLIFGPFYGTYAAAAYNSHASDGEYDAAPAATGESYEPFDPLFHYGPPPKRHHGKPGPPHGHRPGSKPSGPPPHHHGGAHHHHHGGGSHGGGHHGSARPHAPSSGSAAPGHHKGSHEAHSSSGKEKKL